MVVQKLHSKKEIPIKTVDRTFLLGQSVEIFGG
jgi:hypothetical protein